MFTNHKKSNSQIIPLKSWIQQIKQKYHQINPLLLTFIFTVINIWCFVNFSWVFSSLFLLISFLFLFFHYQKDPWLTLFLLVPFLSLLFQNYFFGNQVDLNQILENQTLKVIKKASTYVIVQWNHQKFYWSTFDQNFIVGQILKVNGIVTKVNPNLNSFNFDFAHYLKNENVYWALKIQSFELIDSQNLRFLFFRWVKKQNFANLIQFFVFQLPTIPTIKKSQWIKFRILIEFFRFKFFSFYFLF